jgi:FkbM family methyltransferase
MDRTYFYKSALRNIGVLPLLRMQVQKRFARDPTMKFTSKMLDHPVLARRNTSDADIFSQILIEHEYECIPDNLNIAGLVVDLGANVGYSAAYLLSRYPKAFVFAVEPDPGNFVALQGNLKPYSGRHKAVQAAAWPHKERITFNTSHAGQGNEWARSVRAADDHAIEFVDTVSLPDILSQSGFDRISLLKIDIEGAETELFRHGVDQWIDKVDNIVIELHGDEANRAFYAVIQKQPFSIKKGENNAIVCTRLL